MKILVTGAAGFIGFHLTSYLLKRGDEVIGLDCINDYYDLNLKYARLQEHGIKQTDIKYNRITKSSIYSNYRFIQLQLEDKTCLNQLFKEHQFNKVCNLAAQAGVRYSLENPDAYISSNIVGFANILEACRYNSIEHLVYASSSSVYGTNKKMPLSTSDSVDHPISLYAATKKSNELMAHSYSHLFNLPTTGLRFFTVYGPWGRPDMALFLFTKSIIANKAINVYNNGDMIRDFTYIDDIVEGIIKVMDNPPVGNPNQLAFSADPATSNAPYKIYNIGNSSPIGLMEYIESIEQALNLKAIKNFLPMQPGDVYKTYADVSDLVRDFGYEPNTGVREGIKKFVTWYLNFYK